MQGWRASGEQEAAGQHLHDHKTVTRPLIGDITLDCDVLTVPGADLKIVAYTAPAGTPPAEKLDFLRVTAIPRGRRAVFE